MNVLERKSAEGFQSEQTIHLYVVAMYDAVITTAV